MSHHPSTKVLPLEEANRHLSMYGPGHQQFPRVSRRRLIRPMPTTMLFMRNLGGIGILVANLAQNTQVVHSRLVEGLRLDNPLAQAPYLSGAIQADHAKRDGGA
jgi:hypothetical protein